MTTIIEIFEADDLKFTVPVTQDGSPKNLSGASVVARAGNGTSAVVGTATITNAAEGLIGVEFADGVLAEGLWQVQVRVTISGETQTVASVPVRVKNSV